jgi:hypothetical protein
MTSKIDELQKNDPYALQKINRSIEDFMSQCSDPEIEVYATARLLEHNMLSIDTLKKAFKLKDEWAKEKAKEESIAKAKAEEARKQRNKLDTRFPKLFSERHVNTALLFEYLSKVGTEELRQYITELKNRASFYRSVYHNHVLEAIDILEKELSARTQPCENTSHTPKLTYAT